MLAYTSTQSGRQVAPGVLPLAQQPAAGQMGGPLPPSAVAPANLQPLSGGGLLTENAANFAPPPPTAGIVPVPSPTPGTTPAAPGKPTQALPVAHPGTAVNDQPGGQVPPMAPTNPAAILPPVPPAQPPVNPGATITPYAGGMISDPGMAPAAPSPALTPLGGDAGTFGPSGFTPSGSSPAPLPSVGPAALPASGQNFVTPFSATDNLIGTQINPQANSRLQGTQSAVDSAVQALSGAPSRQDLAQQSYDQLLQSEAQQHAADLRTVGQDAAKFGRIGSGMTTSDLGTVEQRYNQYNAQQRAQLATQAAGQQLGDTTARLGALTGVEGQQFGQGETQANDLRGERGYQYGLSQDAQNAAINQQIVQNQLLNSANSRDLGWAGLEGQIGYGYNPAGTLLAGASQQYGQGTQMLGTLGAAQAQPGAAPTSDPYGWLPSGNPGVVPAPGGPPLADPSGIVPATTPGAVAPAGDPGQMIYVPGYGMVPMGAIPQTGP